MAQPAPVASSWDDVETLMYADEPINFLLTGEAAAALRWAFPPAARVVDVLRKDPDTRIAPGRPPRSGDEVSAMETRDGTMHLDGAGSTEFAEAYEAASLDLSKPTVHQAEAIKRCEAALKRDNIIGRCLLPRLRLTRSIAAFIVIIAVSLATVNRLRHVNSGPGFAAGVWGCLHTWHDRHVEG